MAPSCTVIHLLDFLPCTHHPLVASFQQVVSIPAGAFPSLVQDPLSKHRLWVYSADMGFSVEVASPPVLFGYFCPLPSGSKV